MANGLAQLDLNASATATAPKLQRSRGQGRLQVAAIDGRTRIGRLFQEGSAKIRVPRLPQSGLEAVLINTSGGLTGGDEVSWEFQAGRDTDLTLTTQACEKIYKSATGFAHVSTKIDVEDGAKLSWLPQETILFDRAGLRRTLEVNLSSSSRFLAVEPVILGRLGMGEHVQQALFEDRWRIRRNGQLIHAEQSALSGDFEELRRAAAGLRGVGAFAIILYVGPDCDLLAEQLKRLCDREDVAISQWDGKLVVRAACENGQIMRKALIPLISLVHAGAMPRIWNS